MLAVGSGKGDFTSFGSARDHTVTEALEQCLADIKAGRLAPDIVYVALGQRHPTGLGLRIASYAAGMDKFEARALIQAHRDYGALSDHAPSAPPVH